MPCKENVICSSFLTLAEMRESWEELMANVLNCTEIGLEIVIKGGINNNNVYGLFFEVQKHR